MVKKLSRATMLSFAIMTLVAIITGVCGILYNGNNNALQQPSALSLMSDNIPQMRNSDLIDPSKDAIMVGSKNEESIVEKTFKETPWNGRVYVKLHMGGVSYINVNVDPRDVWLNDDVIIEYQSYYDGNTNNSVQVQYFSARIRYFKGNVELTPPATEDRNCYKEFDSQAGFTKHSGNGKVSRMEIDITVVSVGGTTRIVHFIFS